MTKNKRNRKDNLQAVDNTKKIYKMYKAKKNWVVAPVILGMLLPSIIAGPVAVLAETVEGSEQATTRVTDALADQRAQAVKQIEEAGTSSIQAGIDAKNAAIRAINDKVNTTTPDAIKTIVLNFLVAEVTVYQYDELREGYKASINGMKDLTPAQVTAALGKIETVFTTDPETGLAFTTRKATLAASTVATFEGNLTPYKTTLAACEEKVAEIIKEYTDYNAGNTNLAALKTKVLAEINALPHLSQTEKDLFAAEMEDLSNSEAVNDLLNNNLTGAKAKNKANLIGKINVKKTDIENKIRDAKPAFSTARAQELRNELAAFTFETTDVLAKLDTFATRVEDEIKSNDAQTEAQKLASLKSALAVQIDADQKANKTFITVAQAKGFSDRIAGIKTVKEMEALKIEWDNFVAEKTIVGKTLADAKNTATGIITNLTNISEEEQGFYLNTNDSAETVEQVASNLKLAQDADRAAKVANDKALADSKVAAKATIKKLAYLGEGVKDQFYKDIDADAITKVQEVNSIVETAERQDFGLKATALKTEAAGKIDALTHLDSIQKGVLKTELSNVVADFDKKEEFEPAIVAIVNKAIFEDYQEGALNLDLDGSKKLAVEAINALDNLTSAQKTNALAEIRDAKTTAEVSTVLINAKDLDNKNKAAAEVAKTLIEEKTKAKQAIDLMNELPATLKAQYKAEVDSAPTLAEVTKVKAAAQAENDRLAIDAGLLLNDKTALIQEIKDINNSAPSGKVILSEKEKQELIAETTKATTRAQVKEVKDKFKRLVTENLAKDPDLDVDTANEMLASAIEAHIFQELGAQESAFAKRIRAAKTKEEGLAIYDEAKVANDKNFDKKLTQKIDPLITKGSFAEAQKLIDDLRVPATKSDYQTKLNNAIALSDAKVAANKTIDSMANLSTEEKTAAKEAVAKLTTVAEVKAFVEDLIKKADADLIALAELQIKDGKFEDAAKTIAKITSGTEKARLEKLLADAQNDKTSLSFQAHVGQLGWLPVGNVKADDMNPAIIGTTGKALSMEAISMSIQNSNVKGGITYRAHVRNIGWQGWSPNGRMTGTTGRALTIEALEIKLTDELATKYNVEYRAHVRNLGWQPWVSNGATAGTTGKATPVESIQVRLVKK